MHPERFIVGCADPARPLPQAFHAFLSVFGCPILRMRYESAELAKISINCCLVASVTVANTLAELSERLGADWSEIAPRSSSTSVSGLMPTCRRAWDWPEAISNVTWRLCCGWPRLRVAKSESSNRSRKAADIAGTGCSARCIRKCWRRIPRP